ncbi:sulfatase-like hydrolase/transferase [Streptomyces aculeolatus]
MSTTTPPAASAVENDGMGRRRFLSAGAAVAGAGGLALSPSGAATGAAPRRPNILWLVSEDNNPFIGAYGDRVARTPTLDALASDGVRYENVFSVAPVCAPSRFALLTGVYPQECGPGQHHRAEARTPHWLRGFPAYLREAGYYCTNNAKTDYNGPFDPAAVWDASGNRAHWSNRPTGAPFFAVFNHESTHESSMFGDWTLTTPPESVRLPAYHPDTPTLRRDRAHYYDRMSTMDAQIAARLDELEAAGLADDTIVFYYSDNGGVLPRSKRYCYDSGLHTPLIVRFGKNVAHLAPDEPGSVVRHPVSAIDLPPTTLRLAGLEAPAHMRGVPFAGRRRRPRQYAFSQRGRMDETYDMQRTVRDHRYRYIRNYLPHLVYGQHVVYGWRQAGYREWQDLYVRGELNETQSRFWRQKPAEELYDLAKDPDEVHNLIDDATLRTVRARLRRALDTHLLDTHDNGFIPEGSPLEGYDDSRAPGAYPLPEVLAVAGTAIQRAPENLPRLIAAMRHGNEVVRYWGALGAVMLDAGAEPAADTLGHLLAHDPSVHVRIAAAEALARTGRTEHSVPWLADTLAHHGHHRVRLQAVAALRNIGGVAQPVLPRIEQAAVQDTDGQVRTKAAHTAAVLRGEQPDIR